LRDLRFNEIVGRRLLITGDVGAGKTAMTARLLSEASSVLDPNDITVIDIAPERREFKGVAVGGRLTDFMTTETGLRVMVPSQRVSAPRIEGRTASDVLRLARLNARSVEQLFKQYSTVPTPVLFMNDVSIYLQAGEPTRLLEVMASAKTVVANSYEGLSLRDDHGSGVCQRELKGLALLKKTMDIVLMLNATPDLISQHGIVE